MRSLSGESRRTRKTSVSWRPSPKLITAGPMRSTRRLRPGASGHSPTAASSALVAVEGDKAALRDRDGLAAATEVEAGSGAAVRAPDDGFEVQAPQDFVVSASTTRG